uniref:Uncharacterized protein n=1 Tax=Xiphophorus couchianus TaxID=32473 RepID=A0A3B5M1S0_9TELE
MEYHSGGSLPLLGRPRYCPGANANGGYLCETGHCCGETGCCTYYYELWWFWLLWTVLILFSCCCAYRHRRAKLRVQQQQRQREISLLAYHGANSFPSSMLDLSFLASLKLPSYEEVAAQPSTPPPPYSSVFTTPRYPQPSESGSPTLAPVPVDGSSSCPAITIECETCFMSSPSPLAVLSPSSPRSPLVAPALLLDPLTALHPSDKGGSSSGHASSLSPSPRATQSPPKQTVFSPCVDVFEPGPAEEDEDDDMGADESQYRHRRLTGDSGIEVCRCRVEEEDEDEEEEEEKDGDTDVHDSVDCPARSQLSTGDELTPSRYLDLGEAEEDASG